MSKKISLILWVSIFFYIIAVSALCLWKYHNFFYNSLDLSIINQVFYNTLHGDFFASTIQGHSYLGDHFTPILFLLLPFYALWPDPRMLLILQTVILALTALPIFLIAQVILSKKNSFWSLLVVGWWLLSPFVHNINFFEFHLLPFSLFFIFWALYFYLKTKENRLFITKKSEMNNFLFYLVFIFLALLTREDVALFMITLGVTILVDLLLKAKKTKRLQEVRLLKNSRWFLAPLLGGMVWFVASQLVIRSQQPGGVYAFSIFYHWLLSASPWQIIKHLAIFKHLEMVLGLVLPFFFLPFLKSRWLLLTLVPFAQYTLTTVGGGATILFTHYVTLFLPGLLVSAIFGLKKIITWGELYSKKNWTHLNWYQLILKDKKMVNLIAIVVIVLSAGSLGPVIKTLKALCRVESDLTAQTWTVLNSIPQKASIAASDNHLAYLSSRQELYALRYAIIGKEQYAFRDYRINNLPDYLVLSGQDVVEWQIQYPKLDWTSQYYTEIPKNLQSLVTAGNYGIIKRFDDLVLFKKNYQSAEFVYRDLGSGCRCGAEDMPMSIVRIYDQQQEGGELLVSLQFRANQDLTSDYTLLFEVQNDQGKKVWQKFYPLGYSFLPTRTWTKGQQVSSKFRFYLPQDYRNPADYLYLVSVVKMNGGFEIGDLRESKLVVDKLEKVSSDYNLNE